MTDWVAELREESDRAFEFDWAAHVARLNERLGLAGTGDEFDIPAWPPPWFFGDVDALPPGRTVLVLSLNPQLDTDEERERRRAEPFTPESRWNYLRGRPVEDRRNRYYVRFERPLTRLASTALGEPGVMDDLKSETTFAWERMANVEICPYASRTWTLSGEQVRNQASSDPGWQLVRRVRELLILNLRPALILVNGVAAVSVFESQAGDSLAWERREYASAHRRDKRLWHKEGWLTEAGLEVPVVGFPFLRSPATHNAYSEIDQLARLAGAHLATTHA